ncbi:ArsR/SmtB family transcription factor [Sandaracinus amylolyticus]|uniref:Transcriptional regulator, ArsR family protein n=1 Tax=Sandaracinus amylolyticus TaxID=927083 RepID=A0A0F6YG74_9BACT|nr:metalloregulator ArsR/SmtB family transcription factor [Sandaracinus amylolyticus]AKF04422.1 Transcriptional regulator, ArsR family protein [Sandaracinus amylolyticus]
MATERERAARELVKVLDSRLLSALAEPARVEIVKFLLLNGPSEAGVIAAPLPLERSVVSRHLKVLLDAGLVSARKEGRRRIYDVDGPGFLARLEAITAEARALVMLCCPPPALVTLRRKAPVRGD